MQPFSYQSECLTALTKDRDKGRKRLLVVMATGLGKTAVSAFDLARLLKEAPGRVLYLCHQRHILTQARKTIEAILGDDYSYGNFNGVEKHLHNTDVLFATFQTMANWRQNFGRDEFRYVVVDEVHHAQAGTFRPTVQYFTPESMLGLTATLKRADGLDVTELFDGPPSFKLDLYEALAQGYLCDVDYRIMTDELQANGVLDTPIGELTISQLNRTVFAPKRDEVIAQTIAKKAAEATPAPRIMTFCASIVHAEIMAALMPGANVIHSGLKAREKDNRLTAFHAGYTQTLTTVDMFNEGIDVPEVNVVVFLRSTSSETIFLQQLGRGLRKADGKSKVLVLDFAANCERIEMVRKLVRQVREHQEEAATTTRRPYSDEVAATGPRTHLALSLDGVEFSEQAWQLVELIEAVRARIRGYTKEELIEQLQRKAKELGRTPTGLDISADPRLAHAATFRIIFGSYNQALVAAGLKILRPSYTKKQLVAQLQRKTAELGRLPVGPDIQADPDMASWKTFFNVFGSYNLALEAAGFGAWEREAKYTRAELLAQLQHKAEELGRTPTMHDVDYDPDMASVTAYKKSFVTYSAAVMAAGLTPNRKTDASKLSPGQDVVVIRPTIAAHTASTLLSQVLTKARALGRPPRASEVDADGTMASAKEIKVALRASNWSEVVSHIRPYI